MSPESAGHRTLLLDARQVASLVELGDAILAVEAAFRAHGMGETPPPAILGYPVPGGGVHVKAAALFSPTPRLTVKLNSNFPDNGRRFGLPTIQGTITLFDAGSGFPLAILDSALVTILRTAAATAVAAKHLAPADASTVTICGCGSQAKSQLAAVAAVRPIRRAFLYDIDRRRAETLAGEVSSSGLEALAVRELPAALAESRVCVTCTTATEPFLGTGDLAPGTFVAALGADSEEKQELDARLLASATVVVDHLEACATIGELRHAIEAGLMTRGDVHAELAEVVCGRKPGRRFPDEIIVFDSTGTALQDAALAGLVYDRALGRGAGSWFSFAG
ncbi:MAG TPA: ornithine cyclodeaminase family protein [Gemmatimonadota bacterium]|nr:ornithine cyclodeaminase family protein [Gemmatimonadota bacterium]